MRPIIDVLQDMKTGLASVTHEEREAILKAVSGEEVFAKLGALLATDLTILEDWPQELKRGGVVQTAFEQKAQTLSFAMASARESLRNVAFALGQHLLPILTPVGKGIAWIGQKMRAFLEAHPLDERRLVTARVYVNDPDYVEVAVQASVAKTSKANADDVRDRVERTLAEFLDPEYGGDPERAARYVEGLSQERGAGWAFGRAVYLSELYEVMERVRGLDHVEAISAPAAAIPLERDQLPVSGAHVITVV